MISSSWLKQPTSSVLRSGRVTLDLGEEVGWHETRRREEVLIVLRGSPTLFLQGKKIVLSSGDTFFIPADVRHNVANEGNITAEYIYVVGMLP